MLGITDFQGQLKTLPHHICPVLQRQHWCLNRLPEACNATSCAGLPPGLSGQSELPDAEHLMRGMHLHLHAAPYRVPGSPVGDAAWELLGFVHHPVSTGVGRGKVPEGCIVWAGGIGGLPIVIAIPGEVG